MRRRLHCPRGSWKRGWLRTRSHHEVHEDDGHDEEEEDEEDVEVVVEWLVLPLRHHVVNVLDLSQRHHHDVHHRRPQVVKHFLVTAAMAGTGRMTVTAGWHSDKDDRKDK